MLGIGTSLPLQTETWGWGCGGLMCFVGIIPLIIWIAIGYWMYEDAKKRNENAGLWLVIGLVLGLIGLIIWIVVRPDMSEVRREEQMKQQGQQQWQQQPPGQQPPGQQPPGQQQQPPGQQQNTCPDCGSQTRYIDEHDRWYCDTCQEYK